MTPIRTSIVLDNDAAENRPSLDTEWRDFHSGTGGVWARKVRCWFVLQVLVSVYRLLVLVARVGSVRCCELVSASVRVSGTGGVSG